MSKKLIMDHPRPGRINALFVVLVMLTTKYYDKLAVKAGTAECGDQCFGTRQTSFLSSGRCTASWLLLTDNLRIPAVICLSLLLTEWGAAANTD